MKISVIIFSLFFLSVVISSVNIMAINAMTVENNLDKTISFKVALHCPSEDCWLPTKQKSCPEYVKEIHVAPGNYVDLPALSCDGKKEKLKYKVDFSLVEKIPVGTRLTLSSGAQAPVSEDETVQKKVWYR